MIDNPTGEKKKTIIGIAAHEKNSYQPGSQGYTAGGYQLRLWAQAGNVTNKGVEPKIR